MDVVETVLTYSPVESISAALISVPEAIVTRESSICCAADNARVESPDIVMSSVILPKIDFVYGWHTHATIAGSGSTDLQN